LAYCVRPLLRGPMPMKRRLPVQKKAYGLVPRFHFDNKTRETLKEVVAEEIIPALEEAVGFYRLRLELWDGAMGTSDKRDTFEFLQKLVSESFDAFGQIEGHMRQLLDVHFFHMNLRLPELIEDLFKAQQAINTALDEMPPGKGRRPRNIADQMLADDVGEILSNHGVKLTKARSGKMNKVLEICLTAAGNSKSAEKIAAAAIDRRNSPSQN